MRLTVQNSDCLLIWPRRARIYLNEIDCTIRGEEEPTLMSSGRSTEREKGLNRLWWWKTKIRSRFFAKLRAVCSWKGVCEVSVEKSLLVRFRIRRETGAATNRDRFQLSLHHFFSLIRLRSIDRFSPVRLLTSILFSQPRPIVSALNKSRSSVSPFSDSSRISYLGNEHSEILIRKVHSTID